MSKLKINDLNLYYEINGAGKPLFLIPGLSGTCDSFSLILNDLKKHFTVITLDNRGAGRSIPENYDFTVNDMAHDLSALIDYLGYDKISLLGHSMGGFILQEYIALHSEKVEKAIFSNTTTSCSYRNKDIFKCLSKLIEDKGSRELWHRFFSHWIYTPEFINSNPDMYESAISFSMSYKYSQTQEAFKAQAAACMNYKTSLSSPLSVYSLILYGGKDSLITPNESLELKKFFPDSKTHRMMNSAHIPMIENKTEYSHIIIDFINNF